MFEFVDVDRLDAGAALDVVEQAQTAKRHAEVQEALAMLRVVKTYRHQIPTDKVRLGGDGTGLVDDFACLELAAALHRSVDSVTPQVTELVNLEVRLPRLWAAQGPVGGCHDRPVRHKARTGTAPDVCGRPGRAGRP